MRPGRGRIDKIMLGAALFIALLGIIFVYSATTVKGSSVAVSPLVLKQIMWVGISVAVLFLIANLEYIYVLNYAYIFYFVNIILLLAVLLFAGERYGAKRWLDLGFLSLQPSEFAKVSIIFVLAAFLGDRKERVGSFSNFLFSLLLVGPAFLLILVQPDLGTALLLVPVLFAILLINGENIKYILGTFAIGGACMPIFWHFLKTYQKTRLTVFINPNADPLGAGYTIIQSKIAIGSGGLLGKGWLNGTQSHLKFLPERHNDFIFSVIGEEWGFVGALVVISLYAVIVIRGIKIIAGLDDVYGKVMATGFVTLIAFQVVTNISMTVGLMPVVGIPLPLISYGGSNALAFMTGIGFLLSISRERKR
ncbi:MAG: rod shape-determining protein RodA [Candidatus Omnitrophica bacterium]|nr:rod shape-determining protein RodA [Candidatus Omnitrophota bacterium]